LAVSVCGVVRAFFGDFFSLLRGMSRIAPDSITVPVVMA
jgi:hypothetical protein